MSRKYIHACLAGVLCGGLFQPVFAGPSIKCWTNDSGVKECGTVIPPKYVKKEHEVLNNQGMRIGEVEAEKSPEERAEILRKQQEEERARLQAEKQEKEDQSLLDAYPTENDIILARDGKLASVDAAIQVAQNQVDFFEKNLNEATSTLERLEKSPTPAQSIDDLKVHVSNLQEQMTKFQNIIAGKEQEKVRLKEEYEVYLNRYREIKQRLADDAAKRRARHQAGKDAAQQQGMQ